MRLGEAGKFVHHAKKGKFIAVGWHELGDLSWMIKDGDYDTIFAKLRKIYKKTYGGSEISISINCGQIIRFIKEFQLNDIVLVPDPSTRKILIGKMTGEYEYKPDWGDDCYYPNRRKVQWVKEVERDKIPEKLRNSVGALLTVFSLEVHKAAIEELMTGTIVEKLVKKTITGKPIIKTIIDRLFELKPPEFEEFATHTLNVLGFNAATTKYVGDKGIDTIGTLNAEGLAQITLHVQVKRKKSSIGNRVIREIRGTLKSDEHGAIISTSQFTKKAQEEAQAPGLKTISLIDGETLAEIILRHYDELDDKYKVLLKLKKKEIPLEEQFITSV